MRRLIITFIVSQILQLSVPAFCQSGYYKYKKVNDPFLISTGVGLMLTSLYMQQHTQPLDPSQLNQQQIIFIDRWACGSERPVFSHLSDVTLITNMLLPYYVSYHQHKNLNNMQMDMLIAFEAQLITSGIVFLVKEIVRRPRPYVYATPESQVSKLSSDASRSFFSGHTSMAFCSAMLAGQMMQQNHSRSQRQTTWAIGLSFATCTSIFRVIARQHFPTDVLVGMLLGSLVGNALPEIHQ